MKLTSLLGKRVAVLKWALTSLAHIRINYKFKLLTLIRASQFKFNGALLIKYEEFKLNGQETSMGFRIHGPPGP